MVTSSSNLQGGAVNLRKPDIILGFDFETASPCDIKLGSAAYANHPLTKVMCGSFVLAEFNEDGVQDDWLVVDWMEGQPIPTFVGDWIERGGPVLAHNVSFEYEILKAGLLDLPVPELHQFYDTMAIASAANLPKSLEQLSEALGCATKDMQGNALMKKLCKLNAKGEHMDARGKVFDPSEYELRRLAQYCRRDVEAMIDTYFSLPAMTAAERDVWVVDQKINARGVRIDAEFTESMKWLVDRRQFELRDQAQDISNFEVDMPRGSKLKNWAVSKGLKLPQKNGKETLDRAAIETLLAPGTDLPPGVRRMLEVNQESGRLTSLAKLRDLNRRTVDHRLRWQLRYHGAHTGRWSAKGLQIHNLPKDRRDADHTDFVRKLVYARDYDGLTLAEDNLLAALSLCLRGIIAASDGNEIIGADYSAIEARVLPWLAFDAKTLKIFESGRDIYVEDAAAIGSDVRDLGKVQRLALGFGMGSVMFREQAQAYGLDLVPSEAVRIQRAWRENNAPIVTFWKDLEDGFRELVDAEPGRSLPVGRCILRRGTDRIVIELPSKRRLSYWSPRVEPRVKEFQYYDKSGSLIAASEQVNTLVYFAPGPRGMELTQTYRGKLAENVTQAVARDLLAEALIRLENHGGYPPVIHAHDAVASEVPKGHGDIAEFCDLITQLPTWARGLPVTAEGYRAPYFKG